MKTITVSKELFARMLGALWHGATEETRQEAARVMREAPDDASAMDASELQTLTPEFSTAPSAGIDTPKEAAKKNATTLRRLESLAAPQSSAAPWDSFSVEKTGDEHHDASNFLLNAAQEWWYASRRANVHGAVKWLESEEGALLIYTRFEYRDALLENIHKLDQDALRFKPAAAPSGEALTDDQLADIYKWTFESTPGCARTAPKPAQLVIDYGRAVALAAVGGKP